MMEYYGADLIAMVLTIIGLTVIGNKKRWGFIILAFSQMGWLTTAILADIHGMMITAIVIFMVNIRNFHKWKLEPPM